MTKAATKPAAAAPAKVAAPAVKPIIVEAMKEVVSAVNESAAADEFKSSAVSDAIWVRAKKGVERRCRSGMVFTAVPVLLPVDELTQDQLDAIEADPLLESVEAPEAFVVDAQANGAAE